MAAVLLVLMLVACDPMAPIAEPTSPPVTPSETPTRRPPTATFTPMPSVTPDVTATPTPFPCESDGEVVEIDDFRSETARETLPYRVYLPPCYANSLRRFPLVLLFATGAGRADEWVDLGLADTLNQGIRLGTLPPMVVVSADLGRLGDRDAFPPDRSAETIILDELMPELETGLCLIERRDFRAVGGLGRGAFWAFSVVFKQPDSFSIVAGHSAVFNNNVSAPHNPLEIARNSTLLTGANLRIYLDNGAQDQTSGNGSQLLSDRLTSRQIPHTYIINPVGEANDEYWQSHLSEYLEFYGRLWPRNYDLLPDCRQPSP
jgi:enterochelin esterase-like enzyme